MELLLGKSIPGSAHRVCTGSITRLLS